MKMISPTWIADNIFTIIAVIGSPLLTWFFSKRYYQDKELTQKELLNNESTSDIVAKNLKLYQDMLDDIEQRYEEVLNKRNNEIKLLEEKIIYLHAEIDILRDEIRLLSIKLDKYTS